MGTKWVTVGALVGHFIRFLGTPGRMYLKTVKMLANTFQVHAPLGQASDHFGTLWVSSGPLSGHLWVTLCDILAPLDTFQVHAPLGQVSVHFGTVWVHLWVTLCDILRERERERQREKGKGKWKGKVRDSHTKRKRSGEKESD